jgi:hypothetical protein
MITGCFVGFDWIETFSAQDTLVIFVDLSKDALSESYILFNPWNRQVSFLISLLIIKWQLCDLCDSCGLKFYWRIVVRFSYHIDVCELIYSLFGLGLSVPLNRKLYVLCEKLALWVGIDVVLLIIVIEQSDQDSPVDVSSTHELLGPVHVTIDDLQLCGKWSEVGPISRLILNENIFQQSFRLDGIVIDSASGDLRCIILKGIALYNERAIYKKIFINKYIYFFH